MHSFFLTLGRLTLADDELLLNDFSELCQNLSLIQTMPSSTFGNVVFRVGRLSKTPKNLLDESCVEKKRKNTEKIGEVFTVCFDPF